MYYNYKSSKNPAQCSSNKTSKLLGRKFMLQIENKKEREKERERKRERERKIENEKNYIKVSPVTLRVPRFILRSILAQAQGKSKRPFLAPPQSPRYSKHTQRAFLRRETRVWLARETRATFEFKGNWSNGNCTQTASLSLSRSVTLDRFASVNVRRVGTSPTSSSSHTHARKRVLA